ncbi:MAG: hypothetical protein Q7I98_00890, partial [Erysipelotrichaceae bacterium]|nr:hypothetical protein [Erysipelotrichaceae bacterium]
MEFTAPVFALICTTVAMKNHEVGLEGHSNYAPTITSEPDTDATENQLYQYQMTARDIDNDT